MTIGRIALSGVFLSCLCAPSDVRGQGFAPTLPQVECPTMPINQAAANKSFKNTHDAIRDRKDLRIVAFGGETTAGARLMDKTQAYPAQMKKALMVMVPSLAEKGRTFKIFNRGSDNQRTSGLLARIQSDVIDLKPTLVIVQAASYTALREPSAAPALRDIEEITKRLRANNIDVALVQPQYTPHTKATATREGSTMYDVMKGLNDIAAKHDAYVFPLYDNMQLFFKQGQTFAQMLQNGTNHLTDDMQTCMGQWLADMVIPPVPPAPAP